MEHTIWWMGKLAKDSLHLFSSLLINYNPTPPLPGRESPIQPTLDRPSLYNILSFFLFFIGKLV